ncbi:MAG: UDP-2,3-diacylglucosamine diphosphatase [Hyphomicrobiaceae bacterium]|nr:UDP-2,3-diacylglucosamine diphosphatase [Hyphomicrobiaceae bacterium]MCC0024712.1 UDP-2,3-diacylglucosamine diphosphatase [Hyphomicrobiaceae bacterium]
MSQRPVSKRVRSIFVSDLHLGMRSSKSADLCAFLSVYEADNLFLVGDIVDSWKLRKRWIWPEAYNHLVMMLIRLADKGTRVVILPGNHDAFLKRFTGVTFGQIELHERYVHAAANGKRYLVLHGDQFDGVVSQYGWLSRLGHWAYDLALMLNRPINALRVLLGWNYWSLSKWGKRQVRQIGDIKNWFAEALAGEAAEAGADGVICGHIHIAEMHNDYGIDYLNCGDWVENRTAIIETLDGRFELLSWQPQPLETQDDSALTGKAFAHG